MNCRGKQTKFQTDAGFVGDEVPATAVLMDRIDVMSVVNIC
jgi:hypothetical protein